MEMKLEKTIPTINTKKFIESFIKIPQKGGGLNDFKFNEGQEIIYNKIKELNEQNKPIRLIVLKSRQVGVSTLAGGLFTKCATTERYVKCGILAHSNSTASSLLDMYKTMVTNLPYELQPSLKASNSKEVIFDSKTENGLHSSIEIHCATDENVARGKTFVYLHLSEVAFWGKEAKSIFNAVMQCVSYEPNTMIIIESTANGFNFFKELWDRATRKEGDFIPIFIPWYIEKKYVRPYTGFQLNEYERWLRDELHLTLEQISWYRNTLETNCSGDRKLMFQENPTTPEEAFISISTAYYNIEIINKRLINIVLPEKKISFVTQYEIDEDTLNKIIVDYKVIEDSNSEVKIYEDVKLGYPYVLACDPAGTGSDNSVIQVIDNTNGNQVAVFSREKVDPTVLAETIVCLAKYYNDALVCVETNYNPMISDMVLRMGYTNMFIEKQINSTELGLSNKYGIKTTTGNRTAICSVLIDVVNDSIEHINDAQTLSELRTFVKNPNKQDKPEAMTGCKDDHVMSLAIAHFVRNTGQQRFHVLITPEEKKKSTLWMLQSDKETKKTTREGYEHEIWMEK